VDFLKRKETVQTAWSEKVKRQQRRVLGSCVQLQLLQPNEREFSVVKVVSQLQAANKDPKNGDTLLC
jgi:imidazoleglycerol phosphate synthase glutamine amidotransferase subunit HisH